MLTFVTIYLNWSVFSLHVIICRIFVRTKQQHHASVMEQLETERAQNSEMKTRMHRIDLEYNSLVSSENELTDLVSQLRAQVRTSSHSYHSSQHAQIQTHTPIIALITPKSKLTLSSSVFQLALWELQVIFTGRWHCSFIHD